MYCNTYVCNHMQHSVSGHGRRKVGERWYLHGTLLIKQVN